MRSIFNKIAVFCLLSAAGSAYGASTYFECTSGNIKRVGWDYVSVPLEIFLRFPSGTFADVINGRDAVVYLGWNQKVTYFSGVKLQHKMRYSQGRIFRDAYPLPETSLRLPQASQHSYYFMLKPSWGWIPYKYENSPRQGYYLKEVYVSVSNTAGGHGWYGTFNCVKDNTLYPPE